MCFVVQRSAEDQPNEQEEGPWQPGTTPTKYAHIQCRLLFSFDGLCYILRVKAQNDFLKAAGTWLRLNSCTAFICLPATWHLNLIQSYPQRLYSISTQLSAHAKCSTATVSCYHILHNAALYSICTYYTLIENSCQTLKQLVLLVRVMVKSAQSEMRCKISELSLTRCRRVPAGSGFKNNHHKINIK